MNNLGSCPPPSHITPATGLLRGAALRFATGTHFVRPFTSLLQVLWCATLFPLATLTLTLLYTPLIAQPITYLPLQCQWHINSLWLKKPIPATVPGNIVTDLIAQHIIPHPYYQFNADSLQILDHAEFVYYTNLYIDSSLLTYHHLDIVFKSLDTYATVIINGQQILFANNMFREWTADIKPFVKKGDNTLSIIFLQPEHYAMQHCDTTFHFPADNDAHIPRTSPYTRKSPMHFGWDVAPRILGGGIAAPIYLHPYNDIFIHDVQIITQRIEKNIAYIDLRLHLHTAHHDSIQIEIDDDQHSFKTIVRNYVKDTGLHIFSIPLQINNPKLWFPNTYGAQPLYHFRITMRSTHDIETKTITTGIRTVQLVNADDPYGRSFYFVVNNKKIFARGANYIPPSAITNVVTTSYLDSLFTYIHAMHMNMIRVWGGGVYPCDTFYQMADKYGIMVWQDFMFAGTMYPTDSNFVYNITQEAAFQVKRLRNHPSLVLWCGNNEIDVALHNWGWHSTYHYTPHDSLKLLHDYDFIFKQLLPQQIALHSSHTPYIHTSPLSNWGHPSNFLYSDNHYWGVWHGEQPFDSFYTHVPRFCSEYGFPSLPAPLTIMQYHNTDNNVPLNNIYKHRMRSYKGTALMYRHIHHYFQPHNDWLGLCYTSQLTQQMAYTQAIAAHRIAKPFCMGTLLWQLNDAWPGITWSVYDINLVPKAAAYAIADDYLPIQSFALVRNDSLLLYVVSDEPQPTEVKVKFGLEDFEGKKYWTHDTTITIYDTLPLVVFARPVHKVINDSLRPRTVFTHKVNYKHSTNTWRYHFFDVSKNLDLPTKPIRYKITGRKGHYFIKISAEAVVKNIYLYTPSDSGAFFSNNYFTLTSGQSISVACHTSLTLQQLKQSLKIVSSFKM